MQVKRVINIEDNIYKHMAIKRALNKNGVLVVEHARNGDEGIDKIETAIAEENPYDLLITDMQFQIEGQEKEDAGEIVIAEFKKRKIEILTVICSYPYNIKEVVGNIFYNERSRDIDWDIKKCWKK